MREHARKARSLGRDSLLALTLVTLAIPSARAADSRVSTSAGFEYYSGPDRQLTRTATGELEAKILAGSASLSVGRFDDDGVGVGIKLGAGMAMPLSPHAQLKLDAERATGDSS